MRSAWVLAFVLGCSSEAASPAAPRVTRAPGCDACHAKQTAEWRASLHHAAFEDEDFRASLAVEQDRAFCVSCHAPTDPADGVGCLDCHRVPASHAARGSGHVATVACAGCHDFTFPRSREKMQKTAEEHAASPFSDVPCASCHMPDKSHAIALGSRDLDAIARALDVRATRTSPTSVVVTLRALGVGHDLPTGDLFRRLRVWVWAEGARGEVLADEERMLGRTFVDEHGARKQADDLRVPASGLRTVEIDLGDKARGRRVEVRVYYERVAEARGPFESVFASDVVARASVEGGEP